MIDKDFFLSHWKNPWLDYEIQNNKSKLNNDERETLNLMKEIIHVSYEWLISHETPISLSEEKQQELKELLKNIQGYEDYMFKNAINYTGWFGWHEGYVK